MLCTLEICGNVDAVCSGSRGNEAPTAGLTIVPTLPSYLRLARNAKVGKVPNPLLRSSVGGFSTPEAGPSSRCQIILQYPEGTVRYLRLHLTSPHFTSLHSTLPHFTSLLDMSLHFPVFICFPLSFVPNTACHFSVLAIPLGYCLSRWGESPPLHAGCSGQNASPTLRSPTALRRACLLAGKEFFQSALTRPHGIVRLPAKRANHVTKA